MRLEAFIAARYLFSKKSRNLINYISLISGLIIAFVSLAMVLVLSTFNGIDELVRKLSSSFEPELELRPAKGSTFILGDSLKNQLSSYDGIEAFSFCHEGQAVLQSEDIQLVGKVWGIPPEFVDVVPIQEVLNRGDMYGFFDQGFNSMILGAGLHYHLKRSFQFPVIEPITLLNIPKNTKLSGTFSAFNQSNFTELATFSVSADFDLNYALIPLEAFKRTYRLKDDEFHFVAIKSNDEISPEALKSKLQKDLGEDFSISTQEERNAVLYQTSQSEKWISFAILFFIVLVAAFNIVASLCMLVMEKKQDLFVLKTMGLSENAIRKVFFLQSLFINGLGLLVGIGLGALLVMLQQKFGLVALEGSVVSHYPVKLIAKDLILVVVTVISIAVVTFWPVQKIVKRIELRY